MHYVETLRFGQSWPQLHADKPRILDGWLRPAGGVPTQVALHVDLTGEDIPASLDDLPVFARKVAARRAGQTDPQKGPEK